jgi:hypothetical protein
MQRAAMVARQKELQRQQQQQLQQLAGQPAPGPVLQLADMRATGAAPPFSLVPTGTATDVTQTNLGAYLDSLGAAAAPDAAGAPVAATDAEREELGARPQSPGLPVPPLMLAPSQSAPAALAPVPGTACIVAAHVEATKLQISALQIQMRAAQRKLVQLEGLERKLAGDPAPAPAPVLCDAASGRAPADAPDPSEAGSAPPVPNPVVA